ncbi:MAG: helix-turn-helix domain-containing protein [Rhodocyclaceae bacterium]|nr:helix-turn-helix domain-containing protein [Rhodocyclaceae bacterium]
MKTVVPWRFREDPERKPGVAYREHRLESFRLTVYACQSSQGRWLRQSQKCDEEREVTVHIVTAGLGRYRIEDRASKLGSSALLISPAGSCLEIEALDTLCMSTAAFSGRAILQRLPRNAADLTVSLDTSRGIGCMLYSHLRSLSEQFPWLSHSEAIAGKWTAVELISAALDRKDGGRFDSLPMYHLHRVQRYILRNLQDNEMSIPMIARENGISVRYLHRIFLLSGESVSKWILKQRLERCRESLAGSPGSRCLVKRVGFEWGFNDTAHFSRAFKKAFGASPSEYWLAMRNDRT